MGLLSALGNLAGSLTPLGPLFTGGKILFDMIGRNKDRKAQNRLIDLQMQEAAKEPEPIYTDLTKVVDNAKQAGLHPLEVIRSGAGVAGATAGGSYMGIGPRVSSFSVMANALDQVSGAISGYEAARASRDMAEAQLANIKADTARMGRIMSPSTANAAGVGFSTERPINGRDPDGDGRVDPRVVNVVETYQTDAEDVDMTVGPDADEWLMGQIIQGIGRAKAPDSIWNRPYSILNAPFQAGPSQSQMRGDARREDLLWTPAYPRVGPHTEEIPEWQRDQINAFRNDLK